MNFINKVVLSVLPLFYGPMFYKIHILPSPPILILTPTSLAYYWFSLVLPTLPHLGLLYILYFIILYIFIFIKIVLFLYTCFISCMGFVVLSFGTYSLALIPQLLALTLGSNFSISLLSHPSFPPSFP